MGNLWANVTSVLSLCCNVLNLSYHYAMGNGHTLERGCGHYEQHYKQMEYTTQNLNQGHLH